MKALILIIALILSITVYPNGRPNNATFAYSKLIGKNHDGALAKEIKERGFTPGAEVFIRSYKRGYEVETRGPFTKEIHDGNIFNPKIEVWMKKDNKYELFKSYEASFNINEPGFDGDDLLDGLGPKLKRGDKQAPEGFYKIEKKDLNPHSKYHLGMFYDYPNDYDRAHNRTGSNLAIHGSLKSEGCFTTTDTNIEEIYLLAEMALNNGQKEIQYHSLPFPLTTENLDKFKGTPWYDFWKNLKDGYDYFETVHLPPLITVEGKQYKTEEIDWGRYGVNVNSSPRHLNKNPESQQEEVETTENQIEDI